ncbi:MAG: S24/S26 family peptidase [Acidobacteriota bacterium]|nr:S24/S26 family peptidase [Acidobacteriota bacterium]
MGEALSFEEYLGCAGRLTYTNVGTSMLPLLRQGRDLFTVARKGEGRCQVGDVVLFRRPPGHYVLHRVVEVLPDGYVILGDNCVSRERGIRDEDILGVMTSFVRDGREHGVDELGYRAYTLVWLRTESLRVGVRRVALALRRRLRLWVGSHRPKDRRG